MKSNGGSTHRSRRVEVCDGVWAQRFHAISWLTCARRHTVLRCKVLESTSKRYQSNFGQWPQAAAQVQIWDVLEEAQGDFAVDHVWQIVWLFLLFKFKFTWLKACCSHSRIRVLELSLT